jgi:hypothetical protein
MTSPTPNILQRLNAVMKKVDYIQKEKKSGMNYSIVSHDAVTAKVRPFLVEHGVAYWPTSFDIKQNGNRTELVCQVVFANIDDKNDYIVVDTAGYGIDAQDKGVGKAISYAVKYALLKALGLETGDDPEFEQDVEHKHDRAPHIPPAPPMPSVQGTPGASKAANRATYDKLVMAIRNAPTTKALQDWHKANLSEIDALPPDWVDELRVEYNDRKHELNKVLA